VTTRTTLNEFLVTATSPSLALDDQDKKPDRTYFPNYRAGSIPTITKGPRSIFATAPRRERFLWCSVAAGVTPTTTTAFEVSVFGVQGPRTMWAFRIDSEAIRAVGHRVVRHGRSFHPSILTSAPLRTRDRDAPGEVGTSPRRGRPEGEFEPTRKP
jgi:hypothetical protein